MDLALWNQIEPSGKIKPAEFFRPERMAARLVQAIGITRQETDRVMRMSRSSSGAVFHPNGDAADPGDGHAGASLHYFGIDHVASKRTGAIVPDPAADGLAVDFDFASNDPDHLIDLYFRLERVQFPFAPYRWNGIGAYPFWKLGQKRNPGFHVDLRSLEHPDSGGRWIRDSEGRYIPFTWRNWKREFGMRIQG